MQLFVDLYTTKFISVDSPQLQLSNYLRIFALYDDITTVQVSFKSSFRKLLYFERVKLFERFQN